MPAKGKETPGKKGKKTIARNRVARHDYEITETFEAGVVLTGTEVKSLRERASQINDSFCIIRKGEVWWVGAHIHPYSNGACGTWTPTVVASCCCIAVRSTTSTDACGRRAWHWCRWSSTSTSTIG